MTADPPGDLPDWLLPLSRVAIDFPTREYSRFRPPAHGGRPSAVLVLLADGPSGPDVLLIQRASTMRSHAGQPAFPGGATDPGDDGPVGTALREAAEEVGLDPGTVRVLAVLPTLWLPPSGFVVTPVLAWWRSPHPVRALDPAEVAAVVRVPVAQLVDPDNRTRVAHPSGHVGPAFDVAGMLVWGFTGTLLDKVLTAAGWAVDWDTSRLRDHPGGAPAATRADTRAGAGAGAPGDVTA